MSQPGPWGRPAKRQASRAGFFLWLGVTAAAALLLVVLSRYFPGGDSPLGDPYLVRTIAVLALVSTSLLFVREFNLKRTVRNILMWVAAGSVLILGFSFQNELQELGVRLRSNLIPGYPVQTGARELTLSEGEGGHFQVYGTVNGTKIAFMIDTGATDIVLDPADAQRLGIDFGSLKFDRPFSSANGIGYGARTMVDNLSVGPISFSNVEIFVNKTDIGTSLLGMAFLKRLKSYSVSGGKLILKW